MTPRSTQWCAPASPVMHPRHCGVRKLVDLLEAKLKKKRSLDRLDGGLVVEPRENEFRAPSDVQVPRRAACLRRPVRVFVR